MLWSSTRKRRSGNIAARRIDSAVLRIYGLAFRRIRRLDRGGLEPFRLPEYSGDVVRRLQEIFRGWQVDLLTGLRGRLEGLPHEVVQLRERLQVIRLEVVAPEDPDLVLRDLRMLFLHKDVSGELRGVLL